MESKPSNPQYRGGINLEAALLMLYRYDPVTKQLTMERTSCTWTAAALALNTNTYKLKQMVEVFRHAGVAGVQKMQHGAGRKAKVINITKEQVDIITSFSTLTDHATKSLHERCAIYNNEWKAQTCNLTPHDLKKFYDGAGISFQRFTTQLGPPKPQPAKMKEQKDRIEYAQKSILYWRNKGYDIAQLDEAVFNKDDCQTYAWAPLGQPLVWDYRKRKTVSYVAVCALISANYGKIFVDCKYDAYNTESILRVLKMAKKALPPGYKWGVFMDNASIHNNQTIKDWFALKKIPLIWNSPYRPDLNGIEFFWRQAKLAYRKDLTELYTTKLEFDNLKFTTDTLDAISHGDAKKWAKIGWQHLFNAELIPPMADIKISAVDLDDDYFDIMIQKYNDHEENEEEKQPQEVGTKMRKRQVMTIFSAELPLPKKEKWNHDSDWNPESVLSHEIE